MERLRKLCLIVEQVQSSAGRPVEPPTCVAAAGAVVSNPLAESVVGSSLLPSAEKCGPAGAPLDLAIKHARDHSVRSHHSTFEIRIPDAPRDDEIVVWVALASSGRPLARLPAFGSELAVPS